MHGVVCRGAVAAGNSISPKKSTGRSLPLPSIPIPPSCDAQDICGGALIWSRSNWLVYFRVTPTCSFEGFVKGVLVVFRDLALFVHLLAT